jgi:hypothetical protein
LLIGVGIGHGQTIPQRRGGVKPEKGFSHGGCRSVGKTRGLGWISTEGLKMG